MTVVDMSYTLARGTGFSCLVSGLLLLNRFFCSWMRLRHLIVNLRAKGCFVVVLIRLKYYIDF